MSSIIFVIYNFVITCLIFELSTIFCDWQTTSNCLQKVTKMNEADYVSNRKLTQLKELFSVHMLF